MNILMEIFGEGRDLNALQMSCRGIVIFFIALMLIRIAGRRSFGIKTPLDNIIVLSLGAILSRAIVGVSPFLPVVCSCFTIVILHRLIAWLIINNQKVASIIEGKKIVLFENEKFLKENMEKGLLCEEDILQGVRRTALTESLSEIEKVYLERNGEISAIRKQK